jgi:hypothetical protein
MEKIPQPLKDKLLDYLDNNLSAQEKQTLEQQLQHDAELKAYYHDLRTLHDALQTVTPELPSKNFTHVVMGNLDRYTVHNKSSVRKGIFLLSGVLAAVSIAIILVSAGVFDSPMTTIDLNLLEKYMPQTLPSTLFTGKTVINAIIILNLVLAWIILDRVILKPFFQRRMVNR